ncbi:metallophosphoesterase family protein [Candidatus Dojkabacteria bacterium]|nr:metallophosphoesterase family protein [Candidatus Dojkabacteria bacterium]
MRLIPKKPAIIIAIVLVLMLLVCVALLRFALYIDVEESEWVSIGLEASEEMKIVVFSDSHLGCAYDEKKSGFLKRIIEPADMVIINGDFWDYYQCDFEEFLTSGYEDLFSELKNKETVYIYGNHDLKNFSDERVDMFSDYAGDELKLTVDGNIYHFEHGNRISPSLEERYPYLFRNRQSIRLGSIAEAFGVRVFGDSYFSAIYRSGNNLIKEEAKETMDENEILFTGHTHYAEIDTENHFVNDGLIRHGYGNYVLIEGGEIELVQERY